jgi:hypothetical protein
VELVIKHAECELQVRASAVVEEADHGPDAGDDIMEGWDGDGVAELRRGASCGCGYVSDDSSSVQGAERVALLGPPLHCVMAAAR